MGVCKYCGQNAGLFSHIHKECEQKHNAGMQNISDTISNCLLSCGDIKTLDAGIKETAKESFIDDTALKSLLAVGFDGFVAKATDAGVISSEQEDKIHEYMQQYSLNQDVLNGGGYFMKYIKSIVLRHVMNGEIPTEIKYDSNLPFNFMKDEKLIWVQTSVEYLEQKVRTHIEGASSGISVRIAKGLYYRAGGFKGYPVQTTSLVSFGTGALAVTNKCIYFSSNNKTFRVKYDKIIAYHPYSDAIEIDMDGAHSKPQVFKNVDGHFLYNLFINISHIQ